MKTATTPTRVPESIANAKGVLDGRVRVANGLELCGEEITAEWREMLFTPEGELEDFSKPENRHMLRTTRLTCEEEDAVRETELTEFGKEVALRTYQEAATEALAALIEQAARSPYHSSRLKARLCVAIRDELAALVEEWEAVNTAGKA